MLIEANIGQGVVAAPLSKYTDFHTRICRPIKLTADDCERVCAYAAERIGFDYDLKNIIDLMRYLFPLPVPQRWRRRMMALGSGDPTGIICSAIDRAGFRERALSDPAQSGARGERTRPGRISWRSAIPRCTAPRDFDISPYFEVVKPTIANGFNYKALRWATSPQTTIDGPAGVEAIDAPLTEPAEEKAAVAAA